MKINLDKLIVLDIETLINCFIVCCRDFKTGKKKEFIFFDHKDYEDEPLKFYKFLRNCVKNNYTFVTFNGINFDMQVLHYYYEWCSQKVDPLYTLETSEIIRYLYDEAQRVINIPEEERYKFLIPEKDFFAPTIDVYKQKHYDRPAKATSLKWVQFTMQYPNVEDMPIEHDEHITKDDIETVLEYCWNDVDSTYEFFDRIKFETDLRYNLSVDYKLNLINASEPRMAREVFGKYLCDEMGITYQELRTMKTIRKFVKFKEIIFPYVKFYTPQLQQVLKDFKEVVIDCNPHSKQSFKYSFNYNGLKVDLGLGGIHSCITPGVYTPAEDEDCLDVDVKSMYPRIGIENRIKPAHLGDVFVNVYDNMYVERTKYDKKDPRNYILKILLNSTYGLSSEINSYFYDKQYTYSITINGQLSLLMLVEALYASIPDIKILQKNTDGVTFIYKKKYAEKVAKICSWWEGATKLELEYARYKKMIIVDVNNYIGVYTDGNVKKKGLFETKIEYHKNPSYLVIPKALEAYFVNDIHYVDFIKNHESIYDFCGAVKRKKGFKLNLYKQLNNTELCEEQQKVTRYFISRPTEDAGLLVKDFHDGRKVSVLANTLIQPLNKIKPEFTHPERYKINYDWYINEVRKIVEQIEPKAIQKTLF